MQREGGRPSRGRRSEVAKEGEHPAGDAKWKTSVSGRDARERRSASCTRLGSASNNARESHGSRSADVRLATERYLEYPFHGFCECVRRRWNRDRTNELQIAFFLRLILSRFRIRTRGCNVRCFLRPTKVEFDETNEKTTRVARKKFFVIFVSSDMETFIAHYRPRRINLIDDIETYKTPYIKVRKNSRNQWWEAGSTEAYRETPRHTRRYIKRGQWSDQERWLARCKVSWCTWNERSRWLRRVEVCHERRHDRDRINPGQIERSPCFSRITRPSYRSSLEGNKWRVFVHVAIS